jgi:hypothetical protein
MAIASKGQSLICAGESAEDDLRFERAVRLNATGADNTARPCSRQLKKLYRMVTRKTGASQRGRELFAETSRD